MIGLCLDFPGWTWRSEVKNGRPGMWEHGGEALFIISMAFLVANFKMLIVNFKHNFVLFSNSQPVTKTRLLAH